MCDDPQLLIHAAARHVVIECCWRLQTFLRRDVSFTFKSYKVHASRSFARFGCHKHVGRQGEHIAMHRGPKLRPRDAFKVTEQTIQVSVLLNRALNSLR